MRCTNNSILCLAGRYIARLLTKQLPDGLSFHNLHHTINVVRGVRDISKHLKLNKEQKEILELAAWFHDSGHVVSYQGHELESLKLAKAFLRKENYPAEKKEQVLACIEATKMPQQPRNLLQKALCDADMLKYLEMTATFWKNCPAR